MYYKSIKILTVKRWIDVQDGDLTALRLISWLGTKKMDNKANEAILNNYISLFGLSESFEKIWKKKLELSRLRMKYLENFIDNRYLITDIEILEKELDDLISKQGEPSKMIDLIAELKNQGKDVKMTDTVYVVEKMIRINGK